MPALFHSSVDRFLRSSPSEIVGVLSIGYAGQGFMHQKTDQTESWLLDIGRLQSSLQDAIALSPQILDWQVILEFVIPRKGKRVDAILLADRAIVILEFKTREISSAAIRQVEEYALLLHYFHKPSNHRRIFPFVISPIGQITDVSQIRQAELGFNELASRWIASTSSSDWVTFPSRLHVIATSDEVVAAIDMATWESGPYYPVPTIVDAALALRSGLDIREIAHSEASEHEVGEVTATIQKIVLESKANLKYSICFLTGVPGSGKTLVGLGLAHSRQNGGQPIHFMSGNGPLVQVLQHLFTQEAMRGGVPAPQAKIHARTLIENVHLFAKQYAEDAKAEIPSNHVVIFDEAQRAWNQKQNFKKFGRNYSEPEMLLSIMERHDQWAVIVALIGGGQEINDGEAGLEEWGKALLGTQKLWSIYASPEVLAGGESTAGHRLFESGNPSNDQSESLGFSSLEQLHLRTSNRSLRAEHLSKWVNSVLAGDAKTANDLKISSKFPLYLTRNLSLMTKVLKRESIGESRCGLAGSSCAARLRAEGLEPDSSFHAGYPWEHWYLGGRGDVRSSFQCEVFATEFEIQGLELDWVGLCWGGDFVWNPNFGWAKRKLRPGAVSKWTMIRSPEKQKFRENAYRVLLTRARQGMVIFVPQGSGVDPTRDQSEMDSTADFLLECGVKNIDKLRFHNLVGG